MRRRGISLILMLVGLTCISLAVNARVRQRDMKAVEQSLRDEIPSIVCVNEKFATAGQPKDGAYAKLAQQGFRAVLNLRTAEEGADQERVQVEKAGLRYIHIPVVSANPDPQQVPVFIKAVRESANQPMLIHCAGAQRAGAFWMIYRVLDQGWSEEKAMEEATRVGLTRANLIKFAHDYIASHRK